MRPLVKEERKCLTLKEKIKFDANLYGVNYL